MPGATGLTRARVRKWPRSSSRAEVLTKLFIFEQHRSAAADAQRARGISLVQPDLDVPGRADIGHRLASIAARKGWDHTRHPLSSHLKFPFPICESAFPQSPPAQIPTPFS